MDSERILELKAQGRSLRQIAANLGGAAMERFAYGSSPRTRFNLRRNLSRKQTAASETTVGQLGSKDNFRVADHPPGTLSSVKAPD